MLKRYNDTLPQLKEYAMKPLKASDIIGNSKQQINHLINIINELLQEVDDIRKGYANDSQVRWSRHDKRLNDIDLRLSKVTYGKESE